MHGCSKAANCGSILQQHSPDTSLLHACMHAQLPCPRITVFCALTMPAHSPT
jgi:hypothetical protein